MLFIHPRHPVRRAQKFLAATLKGTSLSVFALQASSAETNALVCIYIYIYECNGTFSESTLNRSKNTLQIYIHTYIYIYIYINCKHRSCSHYVYISLKNGFSLLSCVGLNKMIHRVTLYITFLSHNYLIMLT
jgi:hypothetical protein